MPESVPSTPPTPLGYIVLVREHDQWKDDWDGEVHPTLEAGMTSLNEALDSGWEAVLTAAHPLTVNRLREALAKKEDDHA